MKLIILALAPVVIICLYVYYRDKYEKEPVSMLLKALFLGILSPVPVIFLEKFLMAVQPDFAGGWPAFYQAFVVAGFSEELFKFLFLLLLTWRNINFNEKFDGIVYAVFISLGFAGIENVMYVFEHGEMTGYIRALVSVPGHALFGVTMGFYYGLAKFYPKRQKELLIKALVFPILLHGMFDFILLLQNMRLLILFIPFVIYLYIDGIRKIRNLSSRSIYKIK